MIGLTRLRTAAAVLLVSLAGAANVYAGDLGLEGTVFEPIEEDFRVTLMRLVASHDWSLDQQALQDSARNYTKNLPSYALPRATKTQTLWKDIGIVTTEDI